MSDIGEAAPSRGFRTIGEEPKPRVLLCWFGPEKDRITEVLALNAPTVREVEDLAGVRQDNYDVLVTDSMWRARSNGYSVYEPERHLFVLSFAGSDRSQQDTTSHVADICENPPTTILWQTGYTSRAVDLPEDLLPAAVDLANDDLVPAALSRESHLYFTTSPRITRPQVSGRPPDVAELHSFLRTSGAGSRVLAGWYRRSDASEAWLLPSDVSRPWDWVEAAIQHWARTYRTFPLVGGWWDDPRWRTVAEAQADQARAALRAELASTTARLEAEIAAATAVLEDAQRDAAGGPRCLLTEKGEPLKEAVAAALTQLGYAVVDRDQESPPDGAGKIEDLGAADPDDTTVDPIIEVKGYDRGARVGDIGQMMRHLVRATSAGRSPNAIWWVANHSRSVPPDARPLVLANENAMVREHAEEEVPLVIIDTRHLFQAVQAVEMGTATPAQVRASLRSARGRWDGIQEER